MLASIDLALGCKALMMNYYRQIGRTHRAKDVYETIELAKDVGFTNISIDLIYGLPGQTMERF